MHAKSLVCRVPRVTKDFLSNNISILTHNYFTNKDRLILKEAKHYFAILEKVIFGVMLVIIVR